MRSLWRPYVSCRLSAALRAAPRPEAVRSFVGTALFLTLTACASSAVNADYPEDLPPPRDPPDDAEVYQLDADTAVVEVDINGIVSYTLAFPKVSGELAIANDEVELSTAKVKVDMRSATTDNTELGRIAKSKDFLDVEKYPDALFEIRTLTKKGEANQYELVGLLELHGKKRAITVPFTIELSQCQARARTEFTINRRRFGVESDTMMDSMASDEVEIRVKIEVPRKDAPDTCAKREGDS
jgi:polyisoprenoid-binding protein YceI